MACQPRIDRSPTSVVVASRLVAVADDLRNVTEAKEGVSISVSQANIANNTTDHVYQNGK